LDGAKRKNTKLGPNFEFGAKPKLGYFFTPFELLSTSKKAWMDPKKHQTSTQFQIWSQAQAPHMFCSIRTSLGTMISSDGTQKQKKSTLNPAPNLELGPRSAFFLLHTSFF
jgi:hypothetical protein